MKTLLLNFALLFLFQINSQAQCTKPSAPMSFPASMCEGYESINLSSNYQNTAWYKDADTLTLLLNKSYFYSPNSADIPIGINTFYMVAIDDTCRSEVSEVTITVYERPIIDLGEDISICFTDSLIKPISVTPPMSDGSFIEWMIDNKAYTIANGFNTAEAFTEISEHKIAALYRYKIQDKNIFCSSDTSNRRITTLPCFTRSYLKFLIDSAKSLLSNALELKSYKYYYSGAIDSLNNTLTVAETVYNNNLESEINTSSENLIKAITYFHSMEVSISEIENSYVNIYPNPTSGIINIDTKDNYLKSIKVTNNKGQIVHKSTEEVIDLSNLDSGIYYITLQFQNYEFTKMIMKK